jgi:hypothetical protein
MKHSGIDITAFPVFQMIAGIPEIFSECVPDPQNPIQDSGTHSLIIRERRPDN